jgi:rhodanese-related sulfurtransferase
LAGGIIPWQNAGLPIARTSRISPEELSERLRDRTLRAHDVLDVRRESEWQAGHIPDVRCTPLDTFAHGLPAIDGSHPVAVHCKSGYRSIIACSLLERAGYRNVIDVAGGFDAWNGASLRVVSEQLAKA